MLWSISGDLSSILQTNVVGGYYTVVALLPLFDAAKKLQQSLTPSTIPPKGSSYRYFVDCCMDSCSIS